MPKRRLDDLDRIPAPEYWNRIGGDPHQQFEGDPTLSHHPRTVATIVFAALIAVSGIVALASAFESGPPAAELRAPLASDAVPTTSPSPSTECQPTSSEKVAAIVIAESGERICVRGDSEYEVWLRGQRLAGREPSGDEKERMRDAYAGG